MGLCETGWGEREAMKKPRLGGAIEGFRAGENFHTKTKIASTVRVLKLAQGAQLGQKGCAFLSQTY
jgi:hypothetical protein